MRARELCAMSRQQKEVKDDRKAGSGKTQDAQMQRQG